MSYVKQILGRPLYIDNVDETMLKWTDDGKGGYELLNGGDGLLEL